MTTQNQNPQPNFVWTSQNPGITWTSNTYSSISDSQVTVPTLQPSPPVVGSLYFNVIASELRMWDGLQWLIVATRPANPPHSSIPEEEAKRIRKRLKEITKELG